MIFCKFNFLSELKGWNVKYHLAETAEAMSVKIWSAVLFYGVETP